MKLRRELAAKSAVFIALGAALTSPHTLAQSTARESAQAAKARLQELQNEPIDTSCRLGVTLTLEHLIVSSRLSKDSSLVAGDKIISIDGTQISEFDEVSEALSKHTVGESVPIKVVRNGAEEQLTARCSDMTPFANSRIKILSAAAKRDWRGCLAAVDQAEATVGPLAQFAWSRVRCSQHAYRSISNADAARLAYEAWRRQINETRWDPTSWAVTRGDLLGALSAFENLGQGRLANDLQHQVDAVDAELRNARQASSKPPPSASSVSTGTGFLVDSNGALVTSHHVIDGARSISASCNEQPAIPAQIIASSPSTDLAVLTINAKTPSYLNLASSRSSTVGQAIFTYGYPVSHLLGSEPKFTEGVISALSGIGGEQAYMQISIPVQPGNSGGPVVNSRGDVVGIVAAGAAVAPFLRSTGTLPQNVNWAVKADYASLLFSPPSARAPTKSREEAIERVRNSLCFIRVQK